MCEKRGTILNVQAPEVASIASTIAGACRYTGVDIALTITGRCPDCVAI